MTRVYRAEVFHLVDDPAKTGSESYEYHADGGLTVDDGRVVAIGAWSDIVAKAPAGAPVERFENALIVPGFIDAHVHFPQLDIIGSCAGHLLEWLDRYAFPAELRYADPQFAAASAEVFLDALLRHGTTSALVFATVHAHAADALFAAAERRNMRLITGKVLMDRNAPPALCDTPESAYAESKALIEKWHGKGRLRYAVTPRFACTSSPAQLAAAGRLLAEHPDVHLHTHISESEAEIAEVTALFPDSAGYLDVYDKHGLVRPRALFAHAIHLTDAEWSRLSEAGAAVAFCPSSNLFLGSGLFDLAKAQAHEVLTALATDVGGGASLSLLATMRDGYYVCQLRGAGLDPLQAFYLATLGAARALRLDNHIGNLAPGKEADFLVLDLAATPLLAARMKGAKTLEEKLLALAILGDDRAVARAYVAGEAAHARSRS